MASPAQQARLNDSCIPSNLGYVAHYWRHRHQCRRKAVRSAIFSILGRLNSSSRKWDERSRGSGFMKEMLDEERSLAPCQVWYNLPSSTDFSESVLRLQRPQRQDISTTCRGKQNILQKECFSPMEGSPTQ
jgi:hypothetical protein